MLELYAHPLASYCWKVLMALYENATPFEQRFVDLADPQQRAELCALWPIGKFPVLRDHARGVTVPESTIIIEYLARHYPGQHELVRDDLEVRLRDRFFDLHVQEHVGRIVFEMLRPRDPTVIPEAKAALLRSYGIVDGWLADRPFAAGESFTLADCAAAPALFYADQLVPITHANAAAYLARLLARPSMIRIRREAEPYWHDFPGATARP